VKQFWREYWLWICVPIVVVFVVVLAAMFFLGGGDDTSPFIYNIF
jgi:hypothetical protein